MPAPSLSFDPSQLTVTFLGAALHGWAEGTFLKAARNEESFFIQVGSDGEIARARNKNRSGRVTFTLQQTSTANDVLSAAQQLDEGRVAAGVSGKGYGALNIVDQNGSTIISAAVAWVTKPAEAEFSKELGHREWVLECAELVMFVGGNPT